MEREALVYSAPQSVTVGVASALAVAANTARKRLEITSLYSNTGKIYLAANNGTAVLSKGITLLPGDSYVIDADNYTATQINAISDVAAQTLTFQEAI